LTIASNGRRHPMNVTQANFSEAAKQFEALVQSASFIAIDEEMTGITLDVSTAPGYGDSMEARYHKMCKVTREFALMQVGVCLFHESADEHNLMVARPFNFYVFPDGKSNSRIVMFASTAAFHRQNNMDFNMWINEGIPFLENATFDVLKQQVLAPPQPVLKPNQPKVVATREADRAFIAETMEAVTDWLAAHDAGTACTESSNETSAALSEVGVSSRYELPECNSFLRRVLADEISAMNREELTVESEQVGSSSYQRRLVILRLTEKEKEDRLEEKRKARLAAVEARAGFLRIFNALAQSRKPIIGHNLLFDLMFMLHNFHGPLPPSLGEFKKSVHNLMPEIHDTKLHAVSSGQFTETALGALYDHCINIHSPPVEFADGFDRYKHGGQFHEAGYDAYMTGVVFLALQRAGHVSSIRLNKCYLMRSLRSLGLTGEDPLMEEGVILHLSNFTEATKTNALFSLLSHLPCVKNDGVHAAIRWISDTSALAVLPAGSCEAREAACVIEAAARQSASDDILELRAISYEQWQNQAEAAARQVEADEMTPRGGVALTDGAMTARSSAPAAKRQRASPARRTRQHVSHVDDDASAVVCAPRRSQRIAAL